MATATNSASSMPDMTRPSGRLLLLLYGLIAALTLVVGYLFYRNWQVKEHFEEEQTTLRQVVQQNQLANVRS